MGSLEDLQAFLKGDRPERPVTRDRKPRSDRLTAKAPDLNGGVKLPPSPLTSKPVHREARPTKDAAVGPPILDLEKQRGSQSPHERAEEAARQERNKGEDIEDMAAKNVRAMAEAREQSRNEAARAGMAEAMTENLKEHEVLPKTPEDTGEIAFMKEGGGGAGGAGGAGGLAGGGTVAVASDPGVFTPTYGGEAKARLGMRPGKKKRKKKKDKYRTSGVTKLDRFLRGEKVNQTKKSVSVQEFATWLVEDALVTKKLDATRRRPGVGGVPENYVDDPPTGKSRSGPVRNPWGRGGKLKPAKGQQFLTDFKKMNLVSRVLEQEGSVMSLMKAIDIDTSIDVD